MVLLIHTILKYLKCYDRWLFLVKNSAPILVPVRVRAFIRYICLWYFLFFVELCLNEARVSIGGVFLYYSTRHLTLLWMNWIVYKFLFSIVSWALIHKNLGYMEDFHLVLQHIFVNCEVLSPLVYWLLSWKKDWVDVSVMLPIYNLLKVVLVKDYRLLWPMISLTFPFLLFNNLPQSVWGVRYRFIFASRSFW